MNVIGSRLLDLRFICVFVNTGILIIWFGFCLGMFWFLLGFDDSSTDHGLLRFNSLLEIM